MGMSQNLSFGTQRSSNFAKLFHEMNTDSLTFFYRPKIHEIEIVYNCYGQV